MKNNFPGDINFFSNTLAKILYAGGVGRWVGHESTIYLASI